MDLNFVLKQRKNQDNLLDLILHLRGNIQGVIQDHKLIL